ncbi:MAG: hypothetical protein IJ566_01860 [Cardiobacteriaceae bacterium]|nr:hypothetical protein [Cardiobacteriaceae bacterium]
MLRLKVFGFLAVILAVIVFSYEYANNREFQDTVNGKINEWRGINKGNRGNHEKNTLADKTVKKSQNFQVKSKEQIAAEIAMAERGIDPQEYSKRKAIELNNQTVANAHKANHKGCLKMGKSCVCSDGDKTVEVPLEECRHSARYSYKP